jgi:cytidylate kinase
VTDHIAIAIDGPAASGKSSTAKAVARALGFRHVDSGSLYRAATAARARRGGDPKSWSEDSVLEAAREVTLAPVENGFIPLIDGDAADSETRGDAVTASVSLVARMPRVREWVNAQVRRAGENHDVVVDGRDIGTVVFPHAQLKVFLVAEADERARRRLRERLGREPTADEIIAETAAIQRRDMMDASQSERANDSVMIDTTRLTEEEQVKRIVGMFSGVAGRSG